MRGRERRKVREGRLRRLRVVGAVSASVIALAGAGMLYAGHLENRDGFCTSCHTQPELEFYQRSQQQPLDLASAHAAKQVTCIQCHSGPGWTGRASAMAGVAAPDLLAYLSGHYRMPAVTTVPIGDEHCLKCHSQVLSSQDFNNHFHAFLPIWQARAPNSAASCVDCHQSHVEGGLPDVGFLEQSTTQAVCQRCHASLGR